MKNIKKALAALTSLSVLAVAGVGAFGSLGTAVATDAKPSSAIEMIDAMGLGTNLGNTFDVWNAAGNITPETGWGNVMTTKAMIDEMHKYGFDSLRLPVTWYQHWDSATQTIDDDYIARLKEVIDYCYDNDMYVVMDMHWDWVDPNTAGTSLWLNAGASAETQFRAMWSDIAESFAEYDYHLAFQSMNEVRWTTAVGGAYTDNDYKILNTLNAAFVEEVRATGGNNADRLLVLAGADANLTNTLNSKYIVPDDDMLAVDVHFYNPSTFCVAVQGSEWGYASTWGTEAEKSEIVNSMNKLKTRFVDNGVGVIIGEYGVVTAEGKDKASMLEFHECVAGNALAIDGIASFLWDDGDAGSMEYFGRSQLKFHDEDFGQLYIDLAGNGYVPPVIDWVETPIDENGKFQIGNSTRVKLVFECPYSNYPLQRVGAGGTISYWDSIAGSNAQDAISFSLSEEESTGDLLANELGEADENGKQPIVNYGYINIPGDVAPANAYINMYWAGYNQFAEDGSTWLKWNDITDSAEWPTLVKVYIDGVVEEPDQPTTEPTTEPTTAPPTTTEPTTAPPTTTEPTTEPPVTDVVYGDADLNGVVEIADVVAIMTHCSSTGGTLSPEAMNNADVYQRGDGVGNMDALAVQKKIAQLIPELPESVL